MAYIGSSPTKVVSRQSANIFTYTVSVANTTVFSGADDNGNTLACSPSDIMVHINGLRMEKSDFSATSTSVTLVSGGAVGDEVTITAFVTFESADHYNKSASDTRYVNATGDTMTGNLGVKATLKTTHADADVVQFGGTGYLANWEDAEVYLSENMYQDTSGAYKYLTASHASLYSQTTGKHQFRVAGSGSADAGITFNTALEIDNDGQITTPSNPAFRVYNTASQQASSSDEIITWQAEELDRGGNFASNVFTAPVTGVYSFNCQFLSTNNSAQTTLYIKVGSSSVSYARSALTASNNHRTTNLSWIGTVTAGTAVGVYISDSGAYIYGDASGDWTHFQGFLIG